MFIYFPILFIRGDTALIILAGMALGTIVVFILKAIVERRE